MHRFAMTRNGLDLGRENPDDLVSTWSYVVEVGSYVNRKLINTESKYGVVHCGRLAK